MKVIGENEVKIQLKESTGPAGPAGADGKDGTSVTHSWRGTTLTVTSASGTSSADLKGATGPTGPAGKDYVLTEADKQEIAGMVDVSVDVDDTLTQSGKAADAKAVGDQLSKLNEAKANDADLAKVAKSGSYDDLSNKPTIPTVPTTLPNPNKLILSGAVSAEYDGSSEVRVEIPAGGGLAYELPVASATQLGGVKVGNGLSIDANGVLSLNVANASGVSF